MFTSLVIINICYVLLFFRLTFIYTKLYEKTIKTRQKFIVTYTNCNFFLFLCCKLFCSSFVSLWRATLVSFVQRKKGITVQTRASGVIKQNKNDSVIITSVLFFFPLATKTKTRKTEERKQDNNNKKILHSG